jgi:hypothetical protein
MDAKAANTCEHPDLQAIDLHWQAKRGWHPARHPCHPLICLGIYRIGMVYSPDSSLAGIMSVDDGGIGHGHAWRR